MRRHHFSKIRVDAQVVQNRVSEAKRSASFYAVAQWRMARTYRTWEEATALPVPPLQEVIPKPASPTASPRANAKATVVQWLVPEPPRLCEDKSLQIFASAKNHLLEVPGKENQRAPGCTRLEVERVDAVETTPEPGIITAKVDEIPYLQWGSHSNKISPPAVGSPQYQRRSVNISMKYTSLLYSTMTAAEALDKEK